MIKLTNNEIAMVSGAVSEDAMYGAGIAGGITFVGAAAALATAAPVLAVAFAAASLISSGVALDVGMDNTGTAPNIEPVNQKTKEK